MKYLTLFQILELHREIIEQSGGASGVRDFGALESALARPEMTFGGEDLYPKLIEKAAAMEIFLVLNGFEISASVDEQEKLFLDLASGHISRENLVKWLEEKVVLAH